MILAGVALSSLFSGATTLLQYFADDVQLSTVVYWTFGDLGRPGWSEIRLMYAVTLAALVYFLWNRWNYNALSSGVQTAKSLGVSVDLLSYISMGLCTLIASVAVAFVGIVSFVGLIAPHIVRRFVGSDYRFLLPVPLWQAAPCSSWATWQRRSSCRPPFCPSAPSRPSWGRRCSCC